MSDSVFPHLTEIQLDQLLDMESITQDENAWQEAPIAAVLLAVELLKELPTALQVAVPFRTVVAMAKEIIYTYGNWNSKQLNISPAIRKEMYKRSYEGDGKPWVSYYLDDGFK